MHFSGFSWQLFGNREISTGTGAAKTPAEEAPQLYWAAQTTALVA
jgi:hypothetical protein